MNFGEKCHEEFKFIGAQTAGGPTRELIQEAPAGTCHKVLRHGPKVRDSGMGIGFKNLDRSSMHRSPPSPTDWSWVYRSAIPRPKGTEGDYGRRLTRAAAQFFRFFVPVKAARHG